MPFILLPASGIWTGACKPKFYKGVTAAISLSPLKLLESDPRSFCYSFLIFLAKRFNSAYYRLLNTG